MDAVPEILRALGELAPEGRAAGAQEPAPPLEELVIELSDPRIDESEGRRRAAGRARVEHRPAEGRPARSGWFDFVAPLGPIELEELRWYLERYHGWPFGTLRERAARLEDDLEAWGRKLHDATLGRAESTVAPWLLARGRERRVVVEVDGGGPGAAALLALPWELLADEGGYLFEGATRARVTRRLPPGKRTRPELPLASPLRVLLVIARPEEPGVTFIDPRASARPLMEALAPLGRRVELEVLADGTLPALRKALEQADKAECPFSVVHFAGHGVYDRVKGLGKLCLEHGADARWGKLKRRATLVDARKLGALLRARRVPLFVLEACQTARADEEVRASVAGELLRAGVGSVVAMSHSVLVETARRFTGRFYRALAEGERIGEAMVAACHDLRDEPDRGRVGGHGELTLQDWFVPVLFQEEGGDCALLPAGAAADPGDLRRAEEVRLGDLPPSPEHGFVGRARELLAVPRLLRDRRVVALLGEGGQGKTALAVEAARWLCDLRRVERVAFVSVEDLPVADARVVLDRIGRQLVPGYSVATAEGAGGDEAERLRRARLPVERVLSERRVLLVVDNLESVLPVPGEDPDEGLAGLLELLHGLAQAGEATRLVVTSREAPPAPLGGTVVRIGPLSGREGRELVAGVLGRADREPAGEAEEEWVDRLMETVRGHARSLVLLAPLVGSQGGG